MKRFFGTPATDYLPALGLLAVTLIYLATAYGYSPDARAVPAGVAWVMLVLVILDLVSRTRTGIGLALMRWLNPAGDPAKQETVKHYPLLKQLVAVAWIAGFAAALVLIGIFMRYHSMSLRPCIFRGGVPCSFVSESAPPQQR